MYQRYSSPEEVLSNFTMKELPFFIIYIFEKDLEEEQDEFLYQAWLHKVWEAVDYKTWKESILKKNTKKMKQKLTDKEEARNLKKANKILNIKEV